MEGSRGIGEGGNKGRRETGKGKKEKGKDFGLQPTVHSLKPLVRRVRKAVSSVGERNEVRQERQVIPDREFVPELYVLRDESCE